jgi:hypothetical protein
MRALPTSSPTNLFSIDPEGESCHTFKALWGEGEGVTIQFQHGARGAPGSTAGLFDDDLLAVIEARMSFFQRTPNACAENAEVLALVQAARQVLGKRLALRVTQGVFEQNKPHTSHPNRSLYGHCPDCGEPGVSRERRPDGNDTCAAGHVYLSAKALP